MPQKRSQLNINIDPELLLKLKSEAIRNGKTLTEFVTDKLKNVQQKESEDSLEKRLSRVENLLNIERDLPHLFHS